MLTVQKNYNDYRTYIDCDLYTFKNDLKLKIQIDSFSFPKLGTKINHKLIKACFLQEVFVSVVH
jgi:hypothetical protein